MIFQIVVKFVIGRKFLKSPVSSPGFFSRGVTSPSFMDDGNRAAAKDTLTSVADLAFGAPNDQVDSNKTATNLYF